MFIKCFHVMTFISACKYSPMNVRMKSFHTAVKLQNITNIIYLLENGLVLSS